MNLILVPRAKKRLKAFPKQIQKKAHRQFSILLTDYRHPSLRTRKMGGGDIFEARVDYHYRFTFIVEEGSIKIIMIGMHDERLGKK